MSGILVTGGTGQLARSLARARPSLRVIGRPEFDFDRPDSIDAAFAACAPDLVVNAAAWTAVDAAEAEPEAAARANHEGLARLASLCRAAGCRLVHISTDYVFDGAKGAPYAEDDATGPTGVYGATKLAGEQAVMLAYPGAVILRTSWVYGETGRNFVRTMLGAALRAPKLRVVADQVGCPTNADDLAECVLGVADRLLANGDAVPSGIFHAAGTGSVSWHGFAEAIFAEAAAHGWPLPAVEPIATADWLTPAARPADSRLDCARLRSAFGLQLPQWRPSLARAVAVLCREWPAEAKQGFAAHGAVV